MPKSTKATVVIPTKNPGRKFHLVLNAVLGQHTEWPYDVLVIDSGSTDGTIEFINKQQQAHRYLHLLTIPPSEFGHGKTRNLGAKISAGEFVVFITHDALPADHHWLRNLIATCDDGADCAAAFGPHLPYENENPCVARSLRLHFMQFDNLADDSKFSNPQRYNSDLQYRQLMHFFSDNNACIRKSVWETVNYPDVSFAEDQIWAKTIIDLGYRKKYAKEAAVYHSHSMGVVETFKRSFDESRSYQTLFGYKLCPSLSHLVSHSVAIGLNDFRYLLTNRERNWRKWILKAPFIGLAQLTGHYLGQRHAHIPRWAFQFLSRDHRVRHGNTQ